jgi:hypothetical protein
LIVVVVVLVVVIVIVIVIVIAIHSSFLFNIVVTPIKCEAHIVCTVFLSALVTMQGTNFNKLPNTADLLN